VLILDLEVELVDALVAFLELSHLHLLHVDRHVLDSSIGDVIVHYLHHLHLSAMSALAAEGTAHAHGDAEEDDDNEETDSGSHGQPVEPARDPVQESVVTSVVSVSMSTMSVLVVVSVASLIILLVFVAVEGRVGEDGSQVATVVVVVARQHVQLALGHLEDKEGSSGLVHIVVALDDDLLDVNLGHLLTAHSNHLFLNGEDSLVGIQMGVDQHPHHDVLLSVGFGAIGNLLDLSEQMDGIGKAVVAGAAVQVDDSLFQVEVEAHLHLDFLADFVSFWVHFLQIHPHMLVLTSIERLLFQNVDTSYLIAIAETSDDGNQS